MYQTINGFVLVWWRDNYIVFYVNVTIDDLKALFWVGLRLLLTD